MSPEHLLWFSILILVFISIEKRNHYVGLSVFRPHQEFTGFQIGLFLIIKLFILSLGYHYILNFDLTNWFSIGHLAVTILYSFFIILFTLYERGKKDVFFKRKMSQDRITPIINIGFLIWLVAQLIFIFKIVRKIITQPF